MKVQVETITLTLTREEAYALCNKLDDTSLITHGGYCEYDQIKLLQVIGKELGKLVDHHSARNDLSIELPGSPRT